MPLACTPTGAGERAATRYVPLKGTRTQHPSGNRPMLQLRSQTGHVVTSKESQVTQVPQDSPGWSVSPPAQTFVSPSSSAGFGQFSLWLLARNNARGPWRGRLGESQARGARTKTQVRPSVHRPPSVRTARPPCAVHPSARHEDTSMRHLSHGSRSGGGSRCEGKAGPVCATPCPTVKVIGGQREHGLCTPRLRKSKKSTRWGRGTSRHAGLGTYPR